MTSRLRSQRLWQLLERFPRTLLYRIGRAARVSVRSGMYKDDVIDMLCVLPEVVLERALAKGLTQPDLQELCRRVGRVDTGSKADLAAQILAAVNEPVVQSSRWRPFVEARAFAHRLGLTSQKEWYAFTRGLLPSKGALPADMPAAPWRAYAKAGWTTWGDFLGTGNAARRLMVYRPFREARAYARSLGLANVMEWRAFCRARSGNRRMLPPGIPATPHGVYADHGWLGYGDWLGTGNVQSSRYPYRSYEETCDFVRALGIRTRAEWQAYCDGELTGHDPRPVDIPRKPDQSYRGRGWQSWRHLFGTTRTFRSFAAARAYVRKHGLRSEGAWRMWCAAGNRPADIPSNPSRTYRGKGWVSWRDFLGTLKIDPARIRRRRFVAARAVVRRLGLRTKTEFLRAKQDGRIPKDIPITIFRHPDWTGWVDFLGPSYTGRAPTGRAPRAVIPARKRARRG